jgi:hypothetical protein
MPVWLEYPIAVGLVVLIAPFAARLAKRCARNASGGVALAALLMGIGEVADPPAKHVIEATTPEEKDTPSPGAPPTTD